MIEGEKGGEEMVVLKDIPLGEAIDAETISYVSKKLDEVFTMYDRMKSRFDELYYKMNPSEEDELECRILGNMLGRL